MRRIHPGPSYERGEPVLTPLLLGRSVSPQSGAAVGPALPPRRQRPFCPTCFFIQIGRSTGAGGGGCVSAISSADAESCHFSVPCVLSCVCVSWPFLKPDCFQGAGWAQGRRFGRSRRRGFGIGSGRAARRPSPAHEWAGLVEPKTARPSPPALLCCLLQPWV